jgi:hypothetical protein
MTALYPIGSLVLMIPLNSLRIATTVTLCSHLLAIGILLCRLNNDPLQ